MRLALEYSLPPVVHGILTTVLAILMLSTSPFDFIVRHFFWLLLSVMGIGAINGLFFFPILLSLIGPGAEVIPLESPYRISTPSPPPQRSSRRSNKPIVFNNKKSNRSSNTCKSSHHHQKHVNITNNEPSLTTITEEPQSWQSSASSISSAQYNNENNTNNTNINNNPTAELQSIVLQPEVTVETHHNGNDQNTKVTATANIKVELVTPGRARAYHNCS